ncbi:MAG TPA: HD domain-containing phosphohydrolase, partial [Burkholderiaceae bacterium]|nr:HD domain-containing phosphohydrolase [Burkholderiaceae bacterium]
MNSLPGTQARESEIKRDNDASIRSHVEEVAKRLNKAMEEPVVKGAEGVLEAIKALTTMQADHELAPRIRLLQQAAMWCFLSGDHLRLGYEPAAHAVGLARRYGDSDMLCKTLVTEGIIAADSSDFFQAMACFQEALEMARARNDAVAEAAILGNIGTALLNHSQYRDAMLCYDAVIDIAERDRAARMTEDRTAWSSSRMAMFLHNALANLALCCLNLDDHERGLRTIQRAIEANPEPVDDNGIVARVFAENTYTLLLLNSGDHAQARERCEIAKAFATKSASVRAQISADIAEGLCEIHQGYADTGFSRLDRALDRSRNVKSALRDTLIALVRACEVVGDEERALAYHRELTLHTRESQKEAALYLHNQHLKRLGVRGHADPSITHVLEKREESLRRRAAEREVLKSQVEMLERLAVTAELRDDATGEHSFRVGKLASLLAKTVGCSDETCFTMELAARLHDIGKIGIPDGILLKPGRLTGVERRIMETHTVVGAELLAQSNVTQMQVAEEIARYHHEWWDGTGYP